MENFDHYYPPKPRIIRKERKGHISVTIFSIILFALTFSLIINDYLLILLLIAVLLIHELGHFIFMKLFKYEGVSMLFIPFMGALVRGQKKEYSQVESSIMIMAGPLPGIIAGYFLLNYALDHEILWLIQFGIFFMLLNVTNLIPVDPLDGGQLMKTLFFGNQEFFQLIFSFFSSLGLIAIGLWINSWILIAFGFLLGFRVKNMHKLFYIRKKMKSEDLNYELSYEKLTDKAYAKIKEIVLDYTPILNQIEEESESEKYNQIIARQVDGVLKQPIKKDASPLFKSIIFLIWIGAIFLSIFTMLTIDFNDIINAFQNR